MKLAASTALARVFVFGLAAALIGPRIGQAQSDRAPRYEECRLDGIFPAGGQAGTTVTVEFQGFSGGLANPRGIVIDGPPGIVARNVRSVDASTVVADLEIAADAPAGRRAVRVLSEQSGLTNLAWFAVGGLPERRESEPNNGLGAAERVELPLVINGRVDPKADVDRFQFQARSGQRLVAAIRAASLDHHGQGRDYGVVDAMLEITDSAGRTVAESNDALGLDPLIEYTVPADGEYTISIQLLNYGGHRQATYRLTLGEVPFVTSVFPGGGRRGEEVELTIAGPNIPAGTTRRIVIPQDDSLLQYVTTGLAQDGGGEVVVMHGALPETIATETGDTREQAAPIGLASTVNGRFDQPGDIDWYQVTLTADQPVHIETHAQRFLAAPADTVVTVFDSTGQQVAEADDGVRDPGYESFHNFRVFDSELTFKPAATGEYWVRVSEATGAGGPRHVYRLTVRPSEPDFEIALFPDAVPVWGPGSTASLLVKVERRHGLQSDIELDVEGLAPGWTAGRQINRGTGPRTTGNWSQKHFLTLTAPADAKPGDFTPFRVRARCAVHDKTLERTATPLTLFFTSDVGFFRISPASYAVVAAPQGVFLDTPVRELQVRRGNEMTIPIDVRSAESLADIALVVNLPSNGVGCGMSSPVTVPIQNGRAEVPLKLPDELPPGEYWMTVARSWRSDVRVGMPGPCTPAIRLTVEAPMAKSP